MIDNVWLLVYREDLRGMPRSRNGRLLVKCPFHNDHSPSCDVSLDKNTYYCRACGAGGGCLQLLISAGIVDDKREAAEWMKDRGFTIPEKHR